MCRAVLFDAPDSHFDSDEERHDNETDGREADFATEGRFDDGGGDSVGGEADHAVVVNGDGDEVSEAFMKAKNLMDAYDRYLLCIGNIIRQIREARAHRHEIMHGIRNLPGQGPSDIPSLNNNIAQLISWKCELVYYLEILTEKLLEWVCRYEGVEGFEGVTKHGLDTAMEEAREQDLLLEHTWGIRDWASNV